jgi:hypothetical protein
MDVEINIDNFNSNRELVKACKYGDLKTAVNMIEEYNAKSFDSGLRAACIHGHINIVQTMINYGAENLNWGLHSACAHGRIDIVTLLIEHGADDWNWGFQGACEGNHTNIGELMISKGADDIWNVISYKRFTLAAHLLNHKIHTLSPEHIDRITGLTKDEIIKLLNSGLIVDLPTHTKYINQLKSQREMRVAHVKHVLDETIMLTDCRYMYDQNVLQIVGEYIDFE